MSIIEWLMLGVATGFIASRLINGTAEDRVLDAMLAIVGGMAGGLLLSSLGPSPVSGLNIYGIFGAVIAAIAVMVGHDVVSNRGNAI